MPEYEAILNAIAPALADELMGSRLRNVRELQGDEPRYVFLLRSTGRNHFLVFHLDGGFLFLDDEQHPAPQQPSPFTMYARKHLVGCRITHITHRAGVFVFSFESPVSHFSLAFEYKRHNGNLILCDEQHMVLQAARPERLAHRQLTLGEPYTQPNSNHAVAAFALPADWPTDPNDRWPWLRNTCLSAHHDRVFHDALQALTKRVRRAYKKSTRRLTHVQQDLERAEHASLLKEEADLLQSVRHRVQRGDAFVDVEDWHDPNMALRRIELDPSASLEHAIATRYKDYQRFKKAETRILERLEEVEEHHRILQDVREQLSTLATVEQIQALTQELEHNGVLRAERTQAQIRERARKPYREALSSDGYRILIGRTARDNDTLSLHIARGRDLWLHARDIAGSHVIVWRQGKEDIPHQTLVEAATLAAYYSSARSDTTVDVGYTERKHISKSKGAPPGSVHVAAMKTILVSPDEAACKALLTRAQARGNADDAH